jgi:TolB-like protein/class 3 adenylate cyclase/cytochrome c-type biogenesis protein CcmH/NrfG
VQSIDRELYAFDGYTLDLTRGCLRDAGGEIQLRAKIFELLRYLVQNAGRLISKDELVNAVWPNVIVGDDSLAQCMSELRNALKDRDRHIIKTLPRRGYLFDAVVSYPVPFSAVGQRSRISGEPDQKYSAEPADAAAPILSSQRGCDGTETRRLAAILAADVVGYSRLIGKDEGGTLRDLIAIRSDLIDPAIAAHNGRIVKTTGDGLLVEFSSVVDALRCATQFQQYMAKHNEGISLDKRLEFRIGIHQGDVVVDESGDIFGDGVNVAVRLEALAEAGGICISERVREDAAGKLDLVFEDMGPQRLKNINRAVHSFRIVGHRKATIPAQITSQYLPRLSIVVLPFLNLSGHHEQQYFADAIVDDLTTDLSRITGMLVISRNTAFTYRNKNLDTKQIGRELEVRYVLEGSVRQLGKQARVTAQLIDAEADIHLWADRFERTMDDLFVMQDEITRRIAVALGVELIAAAAARPTDHLDALDYILRGRAVLLKPGTPDTYREAINLFEHALALDPRSAEAQSLLASALAGRALDQMTDTSAGDIARAEGLVGAALVASPRSTRAHFAKGLVLRAQNRFEDAIPEFETVVASSRNWVNALALLGQCKLLLGSFDEAIALQEKAIRLSPRDPLMAAFYWRIGLVHLLKSHTDEAIVWFEKALRASPKHPLPHAYLAAAYGLRGDISRAAAELLEARKFSHDKRYSSIARLKAFGSFRMPKIHSLAENTYFAGLRKVGVPEE